MIAAARLLGINPNEIDVVDLLDCIDCDTGNRVVSYDEFVKRNSSEPGEALPISIPQWLIDKDG